MVFIDGENLVCRFQDMVAQGFIPNGGVRHLSDVYVWRDGLVLHHGQNVVLRATYYTYATGTEERVQGIRQDIKQMTFGKHPRSLLPHTLFPQVFLKMQRQKKGKGVDIQMTVDILTHTFQNNLDTVFLFSGDGDYKPVIETVMRSGKHVYLAAFSSGLNPELPHIVDSFFDLDAQFFDERPDSA